ncbi:hypothetical protein PoB_001057800 [Plakobranchus ocellatus]|uniref:Uncharacterized protein n=1 Tax=Plakobranchus ocellatus TaxID=259542 RepID=A0AAV3YP03_9GAST|nr:hypothetical protein PoB_001057800 [Plakobranchus ocellatus]
MRIACPQHSDLRLSGPPSGQGASYGSRARNRRVPAVLRACSLSTVPPTPPNKQLEIYLLLKFVAQSYPGFEASPQQGDLRLSGPPSGQGTDSAGSSPRHKDPVIP